LTYYYFGGPISESIDHVRAARGGLGRVAVVGLGTGSLACHKRSNEQWTFFEIDPAVVRIARDPRLFNFVSACAPDLPIVVGDARLTLAASAQRYDLIILDAFSSDVIPVHLLTREALEGYLTRLEEGGVVVMHISNRYMELGSVVAALGAAEGLRVFIKEDHRPQTSPFDFKTNARVAVLARQRADLGDLPLRPGWHEIRPEPGVPTWTDDYSNILGAILREQLGR
jgi:spermidine synthase